MRKHHFKLSVIICAVDETGSLERRVATETFDVERRPRARLKAELGVLPVLLLNDENAKVKNCYQGSWKAEATEEISSKVDAREKAKHHTKLF